MACSDPDCCTPRAPGPLIMPADEFAALQAVAAALAVSDAERVEAAAAVLQRRYPAARPDVLDTVISELHSIARAWRRMAGSAQIDGEPSGEAGASTHPSEAVPTRPRIAQGSRPDVPGRPESRQL